MADPVIASGDGSDASNLRLLPGQYPADPVLQSSAGLREPYNPFFDVQWSVGLRGTYTTGSEGERFDTRILPAVSLDHAGSRSTLSLEAGAEVVRADDGQVDVSELRLNAESTYALDSWTNLNTSAELSLTQDIAGTPGVASDVVVAPQDLSGSVGVGVDRQFGLFNVALSSVVARNIYGDTLLSSGRRDNSDQNYWSTDGTLRVGYQATPIFEVFGETGVGRDMFDESSASDSFDATDATLRGGITAHWNDTLEASISTGLALRSYDDSSSETTTARLYDANLQYRPNSTLTIDAGFSTTVSPPGPDGSGDARVEYEATAEAGYTVNTWLALRAGAAWTFADYTDSADTASGYGLSAGADYLFNSHTTLNADYDYGYTDSRADGEQDAHRISLGLTVSR